jgi:hypothetical protein
MYASLVYSNTGITSTNNIVPFNHHTMSVFLLNTSTSTDAVVKLSEYYSVLVPKTPVNGAGVYTQVPGDYVNVQVITAGVTVAVYAIG